ncbi:methyltransferase-domain-containing protein [Mycena pura]|uniref:Ribosomal RNA-processing protein 8 n=1 Tax=Mycena pura TaxID=153505 RepID=A0AAD6YTE6_9AGAR|nr:methyltransferase-domain-containing protein [Mycena pura]
MPLNFDVPGWSMAIAPVQQPAPSNSKKRKRPADDRNSPEPFDLQKLVKKHGSVDAGGDETSAVLRVKELGKSLVKKTMDRKREKQRQKLEEKKKNISSPRALKQKHAESTSSSSSSSILHPAKRVKKVHEPADKPLPTIPEEADGPSAEPKARVGLTALQKGMKLSLDGARFRLLNESLYKTDSRQAHEMMQKDPKMFHEYHAGFRHQVQSWPTNPVQYYISVLSKYPAKTVIADLGCGDAAIARSLIPKGLNVISFDLVSDGVYVVEADICGRLPLPGSEPADGEKSHVQSQVVDVVVCALSLMGTNWPNSIREAWRILKHHGELKIAEVASRFTDVEEFIKVVSSVGFKLQSKSDSNTHFTLFEFMKVPCTGKEWAAVMAKGNVLKPCEYKRR